MYAFKIQALFACALFIASSFAIPVKEAFPANIVSAQLGVRDGECVNGVCAAGLCCSPFGYCGTGPDYCTAPGVCANGVCPAGLCCSQFGYCGTGPDYCGPAPTPTPNCGTGGPCAAGLCCSVYGWCGTGVAYCGS